MKGLEKSNYLYKEAERSEREVVMGAEAREGSGCDAAFLRMEKETTCLQDAGASGSWKRQESPLCPPPRRHATSPPHIHPAQ